MSAQLGREKGRSKMGEVKFKLGEPKPRNEAARKRVQDLTIYDSRTHHETLLSRTSTIHAGSGFGAVFCLIAIGMLVATYMVLS